MSFVYGPHREEPAITFRLPTEGKLFRRRSNVNGPKRAFGGSVPGGGGTDPYQQLGAQISSQNKVVRHSL
jgi:hypothetical protein